MKQKVFLFINKNKYFVNFIYLLIVLNVISIVLESYEGVGGAYPKFFYYFELSSVLIFTVEYLLRIWSVTLDERFTGSNFSKRMKFMISKFGLIDLLAILPFYIPLIVKFDLRILRILRLFRLLRVLKLGRLSKSLRTISSVLKETRADLSITVFIVFIFLLLSSTLMYYVENDAQPEKFANIGDSLWWAVATLTTVGYGDIYPVTAIGRTLSAVIALIGIGFIALPTGIISSAFIEKLHEEREKKALREKLLNSDINNEDKCKCPKCGNEFNK